ncbi:MULTISPECIES: LysR substrate-binding domain-containing protein [unclassified Kocuria]|uniref:LysR substrate-binding domain-containing protein n=1 Tax=Kocuria TaxID=57493 RepID=UPI001EF05057|nr:MULTISPECIES: LysR substrate-binding domain-containing protein [unclassified Kocuria]
MRLVGYTLRQLLCFVAVAEHGSITAAAEQLRVSPSAVSGAVDELERVLRTQLTVRRRAHGVTLTTSGHDVLRRARSLLDEAEDLESRARDTGDDLRGPLMVGSYHTLAPTVLAELLAAYTERHPGVDLDFVSGSQADLVDRLAGGELDLAVVYDVALPPTIQVHRLYQAAPQVVLPADHRLAQDEDQPLPLDLLASEPFILLDLPPSRENTMTLFDHAGITPQVRFRTTDYELTRSLVGRGLGYSILVQHPSSSLTWGGRPLTTRPLEPRPHPVGVCLAWDSNVRPSRRAEAMVDLARTLHGPAHGQRP